MGVIRLVLGVFLVLAGVAVGAFTVGQLLPAGKPCCEGHCPPQYVASSPGLTLGKEGLAQPLSWSYRADERILSALANPAGRIHLHLERVSFPEDGSRCHWLVYLCPEHREPSKCFFLGSLQEPGCATFDATELVRLLYEQPEAETWRKLSVKFVQQTRSEPAVKVGHVALVATGGKP